MTEDKGVTIVNSWNEWDPLKRVIVGRPDGTMVQAPEPAVIRDWPQYDFPKGTFGPLPQEMQEIAREQMDNFASMLEKRDIIVDRPVPLDFSQRVQTPDWVQESMFGCMPPRDLLMTVGNEILEATMSYRSRWFEYLSYRPILEEYFRKDPNFRWEAAPKPRLSDETYVDIHFEEKFKELSPEEQWKFTLKKKQWNLTEKEPLFDAADAARMGKDIFFQRSTVTNGAGISWLRRHFPSHRIHEVRFKEVQPMHIDGTFLPLRPGLALGNFVRVPLQQELYDLFKMNDWEIVECAEPFAKGKLPLSFCSIWLSMNILMLDSKTVCVEEQETAQMEQLSKLGFEVIPVPFSGVAAFGGGLHCATCDVYREGTLEDYFPKQLTDF